MTKYHSNYDQRQLNAMSDMLMVRMEDFFQYFDIECQDNGRMYSLSCPVHGGDNINACNIYHTGDSKVGNWNCWTRQCERVFMPTAIGFARGVLSNHHFDWQSSGDKTYTLYHTIQWIEKFLNKKLDDVSIDHQEIEKKKFEQKIRQLKMMGRPEINNKIDRYQVRESLQIPSQYYIERGYDEETLDRYDVGLCVSRGRPMSNRVVVPIYDDDHRYFVGCTGRALNNNTKPKWIHSKGFSADDYLYNYWFAKKAIQETATIILVEGPGDVWRLEQCGIDNSVAMFGNYLSRPQKNIIDNSGAMSIIVLTDNDEAGKIGAEGISKMCGRSYRLYFPNLSQNDVGDMTLDAITSDIKPVIEESIKALDV